MEKKSNPLKFHLIPVLIGLGVVLTQSAAGQIDTGKLDTNSIPVQPDSARHDTTVNYIYNHPEEIMQTTIIDGDTIAWVVLDEVLLVDRPTFDSDEARRRYYLLKKRVLRAYPYAVIAGDKLDSLNLRLDTLEGRWTRKRHIKDYQDYLENRFEPELRKLTRSEGQILCKLLYRETGRTVYDLISEYRSGWTAFWWNVSANWYDISLKQPYDPEGNDEDQLIEQILRRSFSQGLLEERVPFYPPPEE